MFENLAKWFKKFNKKDNKVNASSKEAAKERLHLVLMQDRANVSADFLELMKQEIIEVIKKYIDVDEEAIDVRLTNKENSDGTNGAPALYANIPIINIKNESRKADKTETDDGMEIKKENDEKVEENTTENVKDETEKEQKKDGNKNNKKIISEYPKKENEKKVKENHVDKEGSEENSLQDESVAQG